MSLGSSRDAPPKPDHLSTNNTSASPKPTLSDDFESAVDEIRAGKSWIQKIANRKKLEPADTLDDDISDVFLPVTGECIVQPRPRECSDAEDLSESGDTVRSLEDAIQLSKFGSHTDRQHLYPVDIGRGSSESRALQPKQQTRWGSCLSTIGVRSVWLALAPFASILFATSVYLQLKHKKDTSFVWHPILMNAMLVLMTVVMAFLQRPPSKLHFQSRSQLHFQSQGLFSVSKLHVFAQVGATVACVGGMSVSLFAKRKAATHDEDKSTAHRIVGYIVVLLFAVQLFFRACTKLIPCREVGGWRQCAVKIWYRHNRTLGYANLALLWIAAWLGMHTAWSKSLESEETKQALGHSEIYWICLFAAFIVGLLLSKFLSNMSQ